MILEAAAPDPGIPGEWVLYGGLITFIVGIIGGATPKLLQAFGQYGQAMQERLDRQRTAAKAEDDADIAELKRSLNNMSEMLDEERRLNAEHRALIGQLYQWILVAQRDPANLARPVPDPFATLTHETTGETG